MTFICGPMATISHPAFRNLVERFGYCDEYFTEMINCGTFLTGGPFEKYYINPSPVPDKIVWQLTGRDTFHFVDTVKKIIDLQGIGIDINMGCSAPEIYKYGAGIAWMIKPISETSELVKSVGDVIKDYNSTNHTHKRFSVKLRLGDDNFTDTSFFNFCDMLVLNGVEMITLHPRTKREKLSRPARYLYCQKLCERYKNQNIKIILNGNITDSASLNYALSQAPDVNGIMISRAAVQKPWIFSSLHNVESGIVDMEEMAYQYINDVEIFQPKEFWKTRLQRFFTYYSLNFVFSHYAQTSFINAKDNDDLRARIKDFFIKCPDEKFKKV